jgi:hypothetical protein
VAVELSQIVGLAVARPGDVGDAPVVLDLDQVEPHRHGLVEIGEFDGSGGFARCGVIGGDIEIGNLPILRINERVEIEQADLTAFGSELLVSDHQRRERGFEGAADGALVVERAPLGLFALVGIVDVGHERERRRVRRGA